MIPKTHPGKTTIKELHTEECPSDDPSPLERGGTSAGDLFKGLPFELQTDIFLLTIPPLSLMAPHQAVVLSQVCKTWKCLAFSMPQVWSSFSFELPRDDDISLRHRGHAINLLRSWLQRSRDYPLDFKLTQERSIRVRSQTEHGAVILSILLFHSERWRAAEVSIWNDNMALAFNTPTKKFPLLRFLTIHPAISKTRHPFSFTSLERSWDQLSTIHLVNYHLPPPMGQVLHILSQAPNVKNFAANMCFDAPLRHRESGGIILENLTQLKIILQYRDAASHQRAVFEDDIHNCLSFLAALAMKSLRSLHLEWEINSFDHPHVQPDSPASQGLAPFFQEIGSTLEELSLIYLPVGEETVLDCFAHLHILKHLQLKYSHYRPGRGPVNDSLLRRLTLPQPNRREGRAAILPRLTTVKFETRRESCTVEGFSHFVQSRMGTRGDDSGYQRLERLGLFTDRPLFYRLPSCLREWEDRLDISSRINYSDMQN